MGLPSARKEHTPGSALAAGLQPPLADQSRSIHLLLPILHARPRLAAPITLACRAFNPSPALQNFIALARQLAGRPQRRAGLNSRHQSTATTA